MAHSKFPVEILTPEGAVFSGEVEMISTRTVTGTIGVLANHEPIMAMLDPTELRLYRSDTDILRFAQGEGYLQMANNRALLLVEEAVPPADLSVPALEEKLADARARLEATGDDTPAERERAQRDAARAEKFIEIAGA